MTVVRFKAQRSDQRDDLMLPSFAHPGEDACFDLYAIASNPEHAPYDSTIEIQPFSSVEIDTGWIMELMPGWEATIRVRSGHGFKQDLRVHPGTIDSGYRGPLTIKIFNLHPTNVAKLDRTKAIAQVAVRQVPLIDIIEVFGELSESARGEGGIGSTDNK